jgi:hypothetical protein
MIRKIGLLNLVLVRSAVSIIILIGGAVVAAPRAATAEAPAGQEQVVISCPASLPIVADPTRLPTGWRNSQGPNFVYSDHNAVGQTMNCTYINRYSVPAPVMLSITAPFPPNATCVSDGLTAVSPPGKFICTFNRQKSWLAIPR